MIHDGAAGGASAAQAASAAMIWRCFAAATITPLRHAEYRPRLLCRCYAIDAMLLLIYAAAVYGMPPPTMPFTRLADHYVFAACFLRFDA